MEVADVQELPDEGMLSPDGGIPLTQVTPIYRIAGYGRLPQEPYGI